MLKRDKLVTGSKKRPTSEGPTKKELDEEEQPTKETPVQDEKRSQKLFTE